MPMSHQCRRGRFEFGKGLMSPTWCDFLYDIMRLDASQAV